MSGCRLAAGPKNMTSSQAQAGPKAARLRTIHVLNGPNLNLLGSREPEIYGVATLAQIEEICRLEAESAGIALLFRQSNAEHELLKWIHEAIGSAGLVINPAAFSHSSYAIYDALKACNCPIVEVHLSNIHARQESWRTTSLMSGAVAAVISGLGPDGYSAAIRFLAARPQKSESDGIALSDSAKP